MQAVHPERAMNRIAAASLTVTAGVVALCLIAGPHPPANAPVPEDSFHLDLAENSARVRTAVRQRLAREVIDGRRSVLAAAALFRELDRTAVPPLEPIRPDWIQPLSVPFPMGTEDEAYCYRVAVWAYLALWAESPARADEVVARLAAEVWAEVEVRGSVRLPDPAALEPVGRLLDEARAALN
jgi:hypothetical protein